MRHFAKLLTILFTLFTTTTVVAQSQEEEIENLKNRIEVLEADKAEEKKSSFYTPQVCGSMMAYYNVSTYDGDQRFAIRNAQVGFRGNASSNVSYYIQVNFHNLAKVTVLDSYITYRNRGFNATLGQQWIHLTADFDRCGPKSNLFTTRSYGVVYIPVYTDEVTSSSSSTSFGNRDIGLYANYTFKGALPITLSAGAFNGAGMNNIEWDDDINLTGRIQIGGAKGVSGGGSIYYGNTTYNHKATIYSGELRYVNDNLFVEANYQQKNVAMEQTADQITRTGLVEGYYTIKSPKGRVFESYAPTLRYDFGEGMLYSNLNSGTIESQDASRLSMLMNIIFKGSKIRSRLTVGYEKVFMSETPSDIAENPLFQDKFTVAMTVAF